MTAVIKVRSLPSAPYPPTPQYPRQTIEVPKDAKVVIVESEARQWRNLTQEERKGAFNRSILPVKTKPGPEKRVFTETELRRIEAMYKAGMDKHQIRQELKCGDHILREAFRNLKAEGRLPYSKYEKRGGRELTEDELKVVREMYEAGAAKHAISTALHCDYVLVSTTIDLMVEDGILQKRIGRGCPRELTRDEINMIVTLRKSGTPLKEISRKLRCNVPLIKDTIWSLKEKGRL